MGVGLLFQLNRSHLRSNIAITEQVFSDVVLALLADRTLVSDLANWILGIY